MRRSAGDKCWIAPSLVADDAASRPVIRGVKAAEAGVNVLASAAACRLAIWQFSLQVTSPATALAVVAPAVIVFETLLLLGRYALPCLAARTGQSRVAITAAGLAALVALGCLGGLGYLARATMLLAGATGVGTGLGTFGLRAALAPLLRRWIAATRRVTRVGIVSDATHGQARGGAYGAGLAAALAAPGPMAQIAGWYAAKTGAPDAACEALQRACASDRLDAVVLALPRAPPEAIASLAAALAPWVRHVFVPFDMASLVPAGARSASLGAARLLRIGDRTPGAQAWTKAAFDRAGASALLVVLMPVLAAIAVLIRLETPGPVLFRQPRVGYDNRLFAILKFRTMHHAHTGRDVALQTWRGDHRVTRVGRALRQLSLDELPQLINVMRGEMSLVGPRPHAPGTSVDGHRLDALFGHYPTRHRVKPGITGLAQVRGYRGAPHTREQLGYRLDADLEYVRRRSLRLDLKIVAVTLIRELRSKSAHWIA